ncbi:response regulator [uncultured Dokdonia sp.]|uniref:LytR/AlgR family response regulator transcription factor n=1 Tax=uncultured Dokdonia sp. TaxID=575653 RepID=UPI0026209770|nr:response regulator [uncultured Dokdonia sp.]
MKAIVIDDEKRARNLLHILITENCPKIKEIYEASNLLDGINIIKKEEPNIVFLDIEMPKHSGLEILNFIDKDILNFEIIFTTAYSEYAIKAFQLAAIDYLLKPIRPNQVKEAVNKAIKVIGKSEIHLKLEALKESFTKKSFEKIALPVANSIKFMPFDAIIMLQADGMYTKVYTRDEGTILITKPLKHYVDLFKNNHLFYKPHRSFLINLSCIKEYVKSDGGYIIMDNEEIVSISRDKKEEFLTLVTNL